MTSSRPLARAAAGLALALAVALTGCAGGGDEEPEAEQSRTASPSASASPSPSETADDDAAGGQSTADACAIVQTALQDVSNGLNQDISALATDPAAAAAALDAVESGFAQAIAGVTNPEVRAPVDEAGAALTALSDQVTSVTQDPQSADPAAVQQAATDVQTRFAALAEVCAPQ